MGKVRKSWPGRMGAAHLYVRQGKDLAFVATVATLPFVKFPEILQWGGRTFVLDLANPRRVPGGEEPVYVEGALAYTLDTIHGAEGKTCPYPPDYEEPKPGE